MALEGIEQDDYDRLFELLVERGKFRVILLSMEPAAFAEISRLVLQVMEERLARGDFSSQRRLEPPT